MRIVANRFVSVIYDLCIGEGEERELVESATRKNPMSFITGSGMVIPAFEDRLEGLKVGDSFRFTLTPSSAYGDYNQEHLMELPKSSFESDGRFDTDLIKVGNIVPMMDSNNNRLNGSIREIMEDVVIIDFNHPLAGKMLHFSGEVLDVHMPNQAEVERLTAEKDGCLHECGSGCDNCCH